MPRSAAARARRTLVWLVVLVVASVGGLTAAVQASTASWTPRLALDLAGGTEIVLSPEIEPGEGEITEQTIAEAIAIIRQRVDSSGVSEAEITSEGGTNIVVTLPGDPAEQAEARRLVSQAAQMQFRPVLVAAPAAPVDPAPGEGPEETAAPAEGETTPAETPPATPAPTPTTDGSVVPPALLADAVPVDPAAPAPVDPAAPAPVDPAAPAPVDPAAPPAEPADPSDLAYLTPEVVAAFDALDCTDPVAVGTSLEDPPDAPIATCDADGLSKYVLGPVEIQGTDIDGASSSLGRTQTGAATNEWGVDLTLDGPAGDVFLDSTARLSGLEPPRNQFAIVLDGSVLSAPSVSTPIPGGQARISGSFTQESATTLANQVQFGALPISFVEETANEISPTLGAEQLQRGLLAGVIGLVLVTVYSLLTYRALGLVTIGSLAVAGALTYLAICLLGWAIGYRLSLAGVAGLIIGIGITADSFIVFFERVRDEVREGRPLLPAVETGWKRARRTILISGAINFLAAAVLYVLAVGSVRGFAFTLGLTSLIDLVVVVVFSHPAVVLLVRRPFFAHGHRLSGIDAEHLGRTVAYAGRGRVRTPQLAGAGARAGDPAGARRQAPAAAADDAPRLTIAERKALAAAGLAEPPLPAPGGSPGGGPGEQPAELRGAAPPRGGSVRGGGTTTRERPRAGSAPGPDDTEERRP